MKTEKKSGVVKTIKILWIFSGVIILSIILYSFIKLQIIGGQGDTAKTLFFAAGIYMFIIYLVSTGILILSEEIIKRVKEYQYHEKQAKIKRSIY